MSKTDKKLAAELNRITHQLGSIEYTLDCLTTAVEHTEALRAAQDSSGSPSTTPEEKPRTEALSDAQELFSVRQGYYKSEEERSAAARKGLREVLEDCPGLSPQEMQELHPECFEDAQKPSWMDEYEHHARQPLHPDDKPFVSSDAQTAYRTITYSCGCMTGGDGITRRCPVHAAAKPSEQELQQADPPRNKYEALYDVMRLTDAMGRTDQTAPKQAPGNNVSSATTLLTGSEEGAE